MMGKAITGDVWVCADCMHYLEYAEGERPGGLEDWDLSANFGPTDEDEDEGIQNFSRDDCDLCDSGLGGYRYASWEPV